ncbi:MAG: family transporter [Deltaproteobacteria bacterium]|nr:family transporter [Deltaproteobacteria bacterium]
METGVLYALIAGLLWGTSPVLVKRGLAHSNVSAATLIQQATILLTLLVAALLAGDLFAGNISRLALSVFCATGVVGAYLGRTLFVKSVDQIGASRAQSLNNSSPLVTVLLAGLFLGEPLTLTVVAGVILIISGVFFVTDPETKSNGTSRRAITLPSVLAIICYGVVPVLKKFGTENGLLLLTVGSLLKIELKWERIAPQSLTCFIAAGMLYAIGSIMTLKALVYAPASIAAPIWSAQPIVSFLLAKVTLKGIEEVTFKDGIAAVLVVLGVLVLRWG